MSLGEAERFVLRTLKEKGPCYIGDLILSLSESEGTLEVAVTALAMLDTGLIAKKRRKLHLTPDGRLLLESMESAGP